MREKHRILYGVLTTIGAFALIFVAFYAVWLLGVVARGG